MLTLVLRGLWIPDFWCLFEIYTRDKNWNSVRRPRCAHTESLIFPLVAEWQMFHTRAARWKQKARYFLCIHLYICFKFKYLFSECIGTNIPEHNTKLFLNPSCTRFESNRRLQREIQRGDRAQEQVHVSHQNHKKASKCYQITSQNTYYMCMKLCTCAHTSCTGCEQRREQYETNIYNPQRSKSNEYKAIRTVPFSLCTGGQYMFFLSLTGF